MHDASAESSATLQPKSDDARAPLVQMRGISKCFGPVEVLHQVDFDVLGGEVHVLAGENGAGKSTLIKILGGVYSDYAGTIEVAGRPVRPRSPLDANTLGIAVIYQELSLVPAMTVAENIFLGRPRVTAGGFVRPSQIRSEARQLMGRLGLDVNVDMLVERLSVGTQQMVEIAKAMSRDARVVVMDEPTSALTAPEVNKLFSLIHSLKAQGCGIIFISHRMEEIERIADRITVLRDGQRVGSSPAAEMPVPRLVRLMVGREVEQQFIRHAPTTQSPVRLRVENFSVYDGRPGGKPAIESISFSAHRGEVLGIGGLQGSGASELLLGIFGAFGRSGTRGQLELDGQTIAPRSPRAAIRAGIAMVTSDRKTSGLVFPMSIAANATLAALDTLSPGGFRRPAREYQTAQSLGQSLSLRAASLQMEVGSLSGGNQQKVVLAKWLATKPRLLLLDEPTRGIDIGAKREVYHLINQWTAQGITILLITSELPELLAMSDRILVLHRGRLTAELSSAEATPDRVLAAAMGGTGAARASRAEGS